MDHYKSNIIAIELIYQNRHVSQKAVVCKSLQLGVEFLAKSLLCHSLH